jgi:hypothetical protein
MKVYQFYHQIKKRYIRGNTLSQLMNILHSENYVIAKDQNMKGRYENIPNKKTIQKLCFPILRIRQLNVNDIHPEENFRENILYVHL